MSLPWLQITEKVDPEDGFSCKIPPLEEIFSIMSTKSKRGNKLMII